MTTGFETPDLAISALPRMERVDLELPSLLESFQSLRLTAFFRVNQNVLESRVAV